MRPLQESGPQIGADSPSPDSLALPALECLARIHAVTLDGRPQSESEFRFYEHPNTGIRGIVAYIPIDSLPLGAVALYDKSLGPCISDP